jgi:hypothetical protein
MSYGRSSMLVALAWVGLVLRVYHEAVVAAKGPAAISLRGSAAKLDDEPARAAGWTARRMGST